MKELNELAGKIAQARSGWFLIGFFLGWSSPKLLNMMVLGSAIGLGLGLVSLGPEVLHEIFHIHSNF